MSKLTGSHYATPSAPMSLQSYMEFSEHKHGTKYPFSASSGLKNVFKVVLNSNSASVNNNVYTFNNVDFKDVKSGVLRCGIQSIISNGNIVGTSVYNLHIMQLLQQKSYDSRTKSITDMVFSGRAGVDYVFSIGGNDCNFELDGHAVKSTNTLQLYFTELNGVRISATNTFQIVLYFYEV